MGDGEDRSVELRRIPAEDKEVLRQWLEHYLHELAEFTGAMPGDDGAYGYRYLDFYFEPDAEPRHAFWIAVDGRRAGFAMVRQRVNEVGREFADMAEFTVHHRYRGMGVARTAAKLVFHAFPGSWHVQEHTKNARAIAFWRTVISEVSGNDYSDRTISSMTFQDFEVRTPSTSS